jgi:hypothetical protein
MAYTICYVWQDLDSAVAEQKFGDHYTEAATLAEAFKDTQRYVRGTLGRQKHKWDQGRVVLHQMWDVSDYARARDRFGPHQKVDDIIRPHIGHHLQADVHTIDADLLITRVNQHLAREHQPLPQVGLAAWQAQMAESVIASVTQGRRTVIAELCARFGKTIWSGVLVRELNAPLTIIVSYVLTSFSSFEKDLSSYEQFKSLVLVDTAQSDYQDRISTAISEGQQCVAFLSMCSGGRRQRRIDWLFGLPTQRLVIVDEADFGVHRAAQAKPLIEARGPADAIVLMTGTNADKAATFWPVDRAVSVVYPELIMEKRSGQTEWPSTLKYFSIAAERHQLVVDIEFYQMDLKSAVNWARLQDPESFDQGGVFLPSWSKFAAQPVKAKGFLTRMLQSVFLGQHGWDELNVDLQTERRASEGQRVAMMFFSGSMRNENLEEAVSIARQALPGYSIVPVYGDEMTNRTAEAQVKEAIERAQAQGQDVLLLSAGMAQRSFSVGSITELYLAYDTGDNGATIQKISRALTPDQQGKIGRIVSLSFDPNRDDKFDSLLIETSLNYKQSHGLNSAKEALREVLRTVDIFRCTDEGSVKLMGDDYLEQAIERDSLNRVAGKTADLGRLNPAELAAVALGNADAFRAAFTDTAEHGKTRKPNKGKGRGGLDDMTDARLLAKVREVITTIVENMDVIVYGTGTAVLADAFEIIASDPERQSAVKEEFGLDFDLIKELFERGVINTDLVELQVDL